MVNLFIYSAKGSGYDEVEDKKSFVALMTANCLIVKQLMYCGGDKNRTGKIIRAGFTKM